MKTEQERLFKKLNEKFVRAFATYHLLEDGDHVLVALSGGKDSLCLLEMLGKRARIDKPQFRVDAIHVRMEDVSYESSTDYLEQFCKELNVPLHIVTTSTQASRHLPDDKEEEPQREKPPCVLCSWNRRKQIFNLAQELGCNKIALGHHLDDIVQTTFMNLCFQGRFESMTPLLKMKKMPLALIRPLCLCEEKDIAEYAELRGYQPQLKHCPHEDTTNRANMKHIVEQLEEISPILKNSVWKALRRMKDEG